MGGSQPQHASRGQGIVCTLVCVDVHFGSSTSQSPGLCTFGRRIAQAYDRDATAHTRRAFNFQHNLFRRSYPTLDISYWPRNKPQLAHSTIFLAILISFYLGPSSFTKTASRTNGRMLYSEDHSDWRVGGGQAQNQERIVGKQLVETEKLNTAQLWCAWRSYERRTRRSSDQASTVSLPQKKHAMTRTTNLGPTNGSAHLPHERLQPCHQLGLRGCVQAGALAVHVELAHVPQRRT